MIKNVPAKIFTELLLKIKSEGKKFWLLKNPGNETGNFPHPFLF
jgi:hypothetical protein